jgi:hypothetical protein
LPPPASVFFFVNFFFCTPIFLASTCIWAGIFARVFSLLLALAWRLGRLASLAYLQLLRRKT